LNNFELIIVNSIYRPEEVFKYLGRNNARQILRRLFSSHFGSSVYHLTSNEKQLEISKRPDFKMSDLEFQD
jgi:dihydroorotase